MTRRSVILGNIYTIFVIRFIKYHLLESSADLLSFKGINSHMITKATWGRRK